jgi:hypothetical protein
MTVSTFYLAAMIRGLACHRVAIQPSMIALYNGGYVVVAFDIVAEYLDRMRKQIMCGGVMISYCTTIGNLRILLISFGCIHLHVVLKAGVVGKNTCKANVAY